MAGNYRKKKFDVDIVLVIDATGSMWRCIQTVKENANRLYDDICTKMAEDHREVNQMRIRVIAFRDYVAYLEDHETPMQVTPFFTMPEEEDKFRAVVDSIQAVGGGDDPEDGLEALAFAIRSNWAKEKPGIDRRQIIVLWTDAATHELGYGKNVDLYPKSMAKDFNELTAWWGAAGGNNTGYMNYESKRLLLYAPNEERWTTITNGWDNVIHVATKANQFADTLNELARSEEYSQIVQLLVKTIQQ